MRNFLTSFLRLVAVTALVITSLGGVDVRLLQTVAAMPVSAADLTEGQGLQSGDAISPTGGSPTLDSCGYPYSSSNSLTSVVFNESEVLRGFSPVDAGVAQSGDTIKVWYNDEHALTLGVRQVKVKTSSGTTTTDYPITSLTTNPGSAFTPTLGSTVLSGDQAGADTSDRPMWPAIFISDITADPNNRAGDWQFGGAALGPHAVFGTWKGAVRLVDKTHSPTVVTVTPDADPAKNNWNLDGGDPAPAGLTNEGYGAEVRWDVDRLVSAGQLIPGHTYRFQFMVHDGDQNKTGGDVGEACTTISIQKPPADLQVRKTLTTPAPVYAGQEISFTIRITNTGQSTVTVLPLGDWYDSTTLSFVGAVPQPNTVVTGTLTWNDLTTALGDLAPGQAVAVVTRFRALKATAMSLAVASTALASESAAGTWAKIDWRDAIGGADLAAPSCLIQALPTANCAGWSVQFSGSDPAGQNWVAKVDGTVIAQGTTTGNATKSGAWPTGLVLTQPHTFTSTIDDYGVWPTWSVNFGNCPATGSIGDRVFYDLNGSGLPDGGSEPGINGVTMRLFSNTCTGTPLKTATTAGNGVYSFTSLVAGIYCVNADPGTVPTGYQLTTGNMPLTVSLATGQNYTTADFGYRAQCPNGTPNLAMVSGAEDQFDTIVDDRRDFACVSIQNGGRIGDLVWNDANGNGVRDYYTPTVGLPQLEPSIQGAVVALTLPGGSVITQTTTITGYYQFTGLGLGQYAVDVIQVPAGYFTTTTNHPQTVNLAAGQAFEDADFGYAGKGLISGLVFYDWDKNGSRALTEGPISDTVVCLYRDNSRDGLLDGGDTKLTCMRTDSGGAYAFAGQVAGAYLVVEDQPPGLENTTPNILPVSLVIVGPGGSAPNNNFGEIVYVRLGDMVYVDIDSDGIQDPGENHGLVGVELQLTGTNIRGDSVNWTTVTVGNGHYLTDTLLPGTYTVKAPAQFGGFQLTSQASRTTALTTVITQDLTLDFGYIFPTGVGVQEFKAVVGPGQVTLSWLAVGPQPPSFHLRRAGNSKGVGAVPVTAQPVTSGTGAYQFVDRGVVAGQTYWYTLEDANSGQTYGPLAITVAPQSIRAFLPSVGR